MQAQHRASHATKNLSRQSYILDTPTFKVMLPEYDSGDMTLEPLAESVGPLSGPPVQQAAEDRYTEATLSHLSLHDYMMEDHPHAQKQEECRSTSLL